MLEDLHWLGIDWIEGPDCGGPLGPYAQSERRSYYLEAWKKLRELGLIYPCTCSRKDVAQAAGRRTIRMTSRCIRGDAGRSIWRQPPRAVPRGEPSGAAGRLRE